jgi:hypothetical protein
VEILWLTVESLLDSTVVGVVSSVSGGSVVVDEDAVGVTVVVDDVTVVVVDVKIDVVASQR